MSKRICLALPEYMVKQIEKLKPFVPGNTTTGTIIAIIEKGINYYWKANRKALESVNQGASDGNASTVDQENNTIDDEKMKYYTELAKVKWVNK